MIENDILYSKQFGFQDGHSADHALVQLGKQIIESCENIKQTFRAFITLSKGFDTVDHSVFLINGSRAISQMGDNSLKFIQKKKT